MIAAFLFVIALDTSLRDTPPKLLKPYGTVEECLVDADKFNRGMNGIGFDSGSVADKA